MAARFRAAILTIFSPAGLRGFRWVLLVPVAILAWFLALFLGVGALQVRDGICPSNDMVSGFCSGSFGRITTSVLVVIFSGVSASFVVISSALVAPTNKGVVATIAFVIGSAVAIALLLESDYEVWKEFISAITIGALTCYFIVRKYPIRWARG